ncbi:MAG: site-specific integrase [Candidatus Nanopelagicales bacterium]|nr:site-specific integrase [Candidatus Nanopelagicales bacterium]
MNALSASLADDPGPGQGKWSFPLPWASYDRSVGLTHAEVVSLVELGPAYLRRSRARGAATRTGQWDRLSRLVGPLDDARALLHHVDDANNRRASRDAAGLILGHCAATQRSYWGWTASDWAALCCGSAQEFRGRRTTASATATRPFVIALGAVIGGFTAVERLGTFNRLHLAQLVFGSDAVSESMRRAGEVLDRWGYRGVLTDSSRWRGALSQAMLINASPRLEDLTTEAFTRLRAHPGNSEHHGTMIYALQRAVAWLGHCDPPIRTGNAVLVILGADPAWISAVQRWYETSTLTPKVRAIIRTLMAKAGRWLARNHPDITEPAQWTRQTCAAWVAAVDRMAVGDYVQRRDALGGRAGTPLSPRTKAHVLMATRTFFRDCQEWEWFPRRFDPARALGVPRSVSALISTDPRLIADDIWAKLLWAGLNLQPADLPGTSATTYYPMELIRAVTLTWLFSGLRSDELTRLRRGCVRWQHDGNTIPADARDVLADDAICLLDVPVHKTGTAFTKPVDPLVGQALEAWQAIRPEQPRTLDRKTSERIDLLFAVRGHPVARNYINRTIIPALCSKAGVPTSDIRGKITSHRARSTIASQLYNAKEPMTLFELQTWLGHRTPNTTQHYAKISPNTLSKAYTEAGYFARNVRTIEVLIDRDAVAAGAPAAGQPWQHYDLGHGGCSYTFFEQCHHRMACARCDFYTPKDSTKAQLLEAKGNLQRMLATIPLTDDERAAVDDGHTAVDALLARLANIPTPAGPTPHQIGVPPTMTHLPIVHVTQRDTK